MATVLECGPVQVLAVAGRNHAARQRLARMPVPPGSRLVPLGFVDNMAELLAAADLVVAKSGGLTTAECLAVGVPMVVRDPIPGQEERNADYLLEQGAGVKAHSLPVLRFKLSALLRDPRAPRPDAAGGARGRPTRRRAPDRHVVAVDGLSRPPPPSRYRSMATSGSTSGSGSANTMPVCSTGSSTEWVRPWLSRRSS
ncbi:MAG: glycosyltransferase [Thermoanaerobaculaceae bacterium]